jgi:hypothetical protein
MRAGGLCTISKNRGVSSDAKRWLKVYNEKDRATTVGVKCIGRETVCLSYPFLLAWHFRGDRDATCENGRKDCSLHWILYFIRNIISMLRRIHRRLYLP